VRRTRVARPDRHADQRLGWATTDEDDVERSLAAIVRIAATLRSASERLGRRPAAAWTGETGEKSTVLSVCLRSPIATQNRLRP